MQKWLNCNRAPGLSRRYVTKTLLVMRLTTIFLTVSILHVAAKGVSQTISFSGKDVPLKTIFTAIEKQTGYVVMYDAHVLQEAKNVTVDAQRVDLQDFMHDVLKDQPLDFTILKETIFIKKKPVEAQPPSTQSNATVVAPPPVHTVTITVTDTGGVAIDNASVTVKGTKLGGTTDGKGHITLVNVDDNATIVVSYIGFTTVSVGLRGRSEIMIQLKRSESTLDETEIIAYGSTTKRLTTGDVSTVSSKDIEAQPVTNALLAIEGHVPGLVVTQGSGYIGNGIHIRIQGQISLNAGSEPLIVVDGVPYPENSLGNNINGGTSGLDFINNYDIASVTVLKDADATSIYGSRAAAGAILITTKKGAQGDSKLSFNYQTGFCQTTRHIDYMNTQQYLQMRRQAVASDGLSAPLANYYDMNGVWDTTRYTDWEKVFYGGSAPFTSAQLSVYGGNGNTQFRLSGNYHRQGIMSPGNFGVQQGSAALNVTNASLNRKLKSQVNMQFSVNQNHMPWDYDFSRLRMTPDAPPLFHPDGSLNWARIPTGNGTDSISTWSNPVANYWYVKQLALIDNFVGNATESYEVFKGFEVKGLFGYNFQYGNSYQLFPATIIRPEYFQQYAAASRYSQFTMGNQKSWQGDFSGRYHRHIGKGELEALGGITFNEATIWQQFLMAQNFGSDAVLQDISAAQSLTGSTSASSDYRYNGVYGRLNYNWDNKYIFDGNWRRDGSSRFGEANRFHDFWSVAGAWIFSEERAIKNALPFLSFGKLRASYGTTGSDQIGDYSYLTSYGFSSLQVPFQNSASVYVGGLSNPYLEWEETRKLTASVDLGFAKGRLLLYANYYRDRSSNQLMPYQLPAITGFTGIEENFPATIQNSGWEFTLNSINIRNKNFDWTTSINLTRAHNKLISFPGLATSSFAYTYIIGQPITVIHEFRSAGVDPQTGLYQFYKSDGTKTSNPVYNGQPNSDQTKIVDPTPDFYGGMQNNFRYKSFTVSTFFNFSRQFQSIEGLYDQFPGATGTNQPTKLLNSSWKQPGDNAQFARFTTTFNIPNITNSVWAHQASDADFVKATYLRFRSLSLSWQMPQEWLHRARMMGSSVRLFVQTENLFTICTYPGLDPETGTSTVPPLRTITFGIEAVL